jgi:hypothetical protein
MKITCETYMKSQKKFKQQSLSSGKKLMLLQHDNGRCHHGAVTSAVIELIRFEVVPHLAYSQDLAPSDFWLFAALKKHLKGIHFTCDKEVQLIQESDFENGLKSSIVTGLKNFFSAGSLVLNERETAWKNEV